jgi:hypothetical protein
MSAPQSSQPLTFTRPSRSGGPDHVIAVNPADLCPESCSCLAGRHGIVCHAVLELAAGEALKIIALQRWQEARGVDQLVAAAKVWGKVVKRAASLSAPPRPAPSSPAARPSAPRAPSTRTPATSSPTPAGMPWHTPRPAPTCSAPAGL